MYFLNKAEVLEFVRERIDLFNAAGRTNPFACGAWMLHFLEQIAESDWTFVIPTYLAEGESLMLLYSEPGRLYRRSAVTNYYGSLYSPIISSAQDRHAAVNEMVQQLSELRPRCAVANFAPVDKDSADTIALIKAFTNNRWYVKRYFSSANWYIRCAGLSFEQYMNTRDAALYNTWLRKSKKFGTRTRARLEIVTEPSDTDAAIDAYERVYARSWKQPEPYQNFIRGWARICAENGWLRLGLAWLEDVPIAAQFWFVMNGRAYIFKLAYDEEYSKLSPGTLLTAYLFKCCLDRDQVDEVDFLSGDDEYKRSWMTERRERIGLLACNLRTARGVMIGAVERAGELRRPRTVRVPTEQAVPRPELDATI